MVKLKTLIKQLQKYELELGDLEVTFYENRTKYLGKKVLFGKHLLTGGLSIEIKGDYD